MKKLIAILLTASILLTSLYSFIVIINFKVQQDTIAKELCIQKDVENNCCKGTCQLKKQLEKPETQSESPAPTQEVKSQITLFNHECVSGNTKIFESKHKKLYSRYIDMLSSTYHLSIFHPPQV